MAKIREDLIGSVHVDGYVLYAGDNVPAGVTVGAYLNAPEPKRTPKAEPAAEGVEDKPKPKRGRPRKKPAEDAGDAAVE